jgi:hypothetical protein
LHVVDLDAVTLRTYRDVLGVAAEGDALERNVVLVRKYSFAYNFRQAMDLQQRIF